MLPLAAVPDPALPARAAADVQQKQAVALSGLAASSHPLPLAKGSCPRDLFSIPGRIKEGFKDP